MTKKLDYKYIKQKIGIVIQARMNSTRLPGKVMMDFCGKPMLLFQINLLEKFNLRAKIVIATSDNPLDDKIADFCKKIGIKFVRGSEDNVFERYQLTVKKYNFDHIIRLTGDNPLTNYIVIKTCLEKHIKINPDLTSTRKILGDNSIERFTPKGNSVDVINSNTLLNIKLESLNDFEKEHVIPVFFNGNFHVSYVKLSTKHNISFSIDDKNDFERISKFAQKYIDKGALLQELDLPKVDQ